MQRITAFLQESVGISPDNQAKILYSIISLVIVSLVRFFILKLVWRCTEDPKSRYSWKRSVGFAGGLLTVILIGSVLIKAIGEF